MIVPLPLPLPDAEAIVAAFVGAIGPQTALVVVDAVSSATGAVLPAEEVARACRDRNVRCFIDAAHAPGLIPVDLAETSATYWAANLHKWVCAPKGSGVLYADPEARRDLRPLVTSHGYLTTLHARFGWTGTYDPSAYLAAPAAIELLGSLGWPEVMARNAALAERGRQIVAEAVGGHQLIPCDRAAAMTLVPLPDSVPGDRAVLRPAQARFYDQSRIEVPFVGWNGGAYLRLSAQLYNRIEDFERLAEALPGFLASAF